MNFIQITQEFLSTFKTIDVEVEITNFSYYQSYSDIIKKFNDGEKTYYDNIIYGVEEDLPIYKCIVTVNSFKSITKFEGWLKELEYQLLSDFADWRKDKVESQVYQVAFDVFYYINSVLDCFGVKESSDNIWFKNEEKLYLTNDIYEYNGLNIKYIENNKRPQAIDYLMDYEPVLSYYVKILLGTLLRIAKYFEGFNEFQVKIRSLKKIHDSFTLQDKINFSISNAADLKSYLELKGMLVDGDTFDFYRLFKNKQLNQKIKWIKGPGHLKHFIQILKGGKIIKTESLFETVVKCFEFVGDEYSKEISITNLQHGHIPKATTLSSEKIIKNFPR